VGCRGCGVEALWTIRRIEMHRRRHGTLPQASSKRTDQYGPMPFQQSIRVCPATAWIMMLCVERSHMSATHSCSRRDTQYLFRVAKSSSRRPRICGLGSGPRYTAIPSFSTTSETAPDDSQSGLLQNILPGYWNGRLEVRLFPIKRCGSPNRRLTGWRPAGLPVGRLSCWFKPHRQFHASPMETT
jgi:hypothetical protein